MHCHIVFFKIKRIKKIRTFHAPILFPLQFVFVLYVNFSYSIFVVGRPLLFYSSSFFLHLFQPLLMYIVNNVQYFAPFSINDNVIWKQTSSPVRVLTLIDSMNFLDTCGISLLRHFVTCGSVDMDSINASFTFF